MENGQGKEKEHHFTFKLRSLLKSNKEKARREGEWSEKDQRVSCLWREGDLGQV